MPNEMKNASNSGKKLPQQDKSLTAVLEHQAAISSIEEEIFNIESLISAKRQEGFLMKAAVPSIDHISRAREDLLAAIAIGDASDVEISEFDAKCEAEKKAYQAASAKAKQISDEGEQAISGLQRKLDAAKERLRILRLKDRSLLREALVQLAEISCEQYVKSALEVKSHYLRLIAIDGLLKSTGIKSSGVIGFNVEISLPMFALTACEGQANPNWPNVIFSDFHANVSGVTNGAKEALLADLHASGLTLI